MIFFVANDGTIVKSGPSFVYQGSEDASCVCVVAPFAANAECTAVFKLPNGELKSPLLLTAEGMVEGAINSASGKAYALWKKDIPEPIARYYGEVQVQFFFHFTDRVIATSASTFMVGRGVGRVLPNTPTPTIYEDILSNIAALRSQLDNGSFTARSIYQWNVYHFSNELPERGYGITKTGQYVEFYRQYDDGEDTGCYTIKVLDGHASSTHILYYIDEELDEYAEVGDSFYDIPESYLSPMDSPIYGAGEIVFYPNIGEFGAFVKSIKENNRNNPPYIGGKLNKEWWAEVVNFNNITEDYLSTLNEVASRAEEQATLALQYAQNAGASNREALDSKNAAAQSADQAAKLASSAEQSATAAQENADKVKDVLDNLDEALKEAANNVIIETKEVLNKVIEDTDSALEELKASTEQAKGMAEEAQSAAEGSAQSAADSAQSAADTLKSLEKIKEQLLATQETLDTALGYIEQLEEQIVEKIGTSVYKDGKALARFDVSAYPTPDAGALYDGQGNLKSGTPELNADCVRVQDIAQLLVGGGFFAPITTEDDDILVTEDGNALQINLTL